MTTTTPLDWPALIDALIVTEGGYSDDPADAGGETNMGITAAVARAYGYTGAMAALPRAAARDIYTDRYVDEPQLPALAAIDAPLAAHLFDAGVNMGPVTVGKMLQRALNVLAYQGVPYGALAVDGVLGRMTRAAITALYAQRGADGGLVLRGMLTALQSVHYVELAEAAPSQGKFEYGWQLNRAIGHAAWATA